MRPHRYAILHRPPQGWASLALFLGMLAVVGVSIADARPLAVVAGGEPRTGSLVIVMLTAGLVGYVLARSSLGIVRSHILGALTGATILLLLVAAAVQDSNDLLVPDLDALGRRMAALNVELQTNVSAWLDGPDGIPVAATLLVLAAIGWTTGQFGAFSIFRYDRGGPAVMGTGALLFLNVATESIKDDSELLPLVPVLAIYSALAMLLFIRLKLVQQGEQWARRHISDAGEVSRLFLRSGTIFVLLAVVGASSLAATAVTRPPELDLEDIGAPFEDLAESLSHLLEIFAVPVGQAEASEFGDSFEVAESWAKGGGIALVARASSGAVDTAPSDVRGNYFWGGAYDRFDGFSWTRDGTAEVDVAPDDPLPGDTSANSVGRIDMTTRITPLDSGLARGTLFGLSETVSADRAVTASTVSSGRGLGDITFAKTVEKGDSYTVRSRVYDYLGDDLALTANELRQAPTRYPAWVERRYLQRMAEGTAPLTAATARAIEAELSGTPALDNPYEKALLLQDRLGAMEYAIDITGVCGGLNTPECLLRHQKGFCQQFATTMTMVLREMGIPSRLVQGFLPGTRLPNGDYEVPNQALHAWVEVYFPGYGWVRFDPTPPAVGDGLYNQAVTRFPIGAAIDPTVPEASPDSSDGLATTPEPTLLPLPAADAGGSGTPDDGGTLVLALTFGSLMILAALAVLYVTIHRLRRLPSTDGAFAYRGIVSLAARLGYGPLPTQTEYEYARSLAEVLPSVRDDLYLVADVRVHSVYGRRQASPDHLIALRQAYARIRTALLRLVLRRPD